MFCRDCIYPIVCVLVYLVVPPVHLVQAGRQVHHGQILYNTLSGDTNDSINVGARSTKHGSSELRVIGNNAHLVDSYFLHLTMHT